VHGPGRRGSGLFQGKAGWVHANTILQRGIRKSQMHQFRMRHGVLKGKSPGQCLHPDKRSPSLTQPAPSIRFFPSPIGSISQYLYMPRIINSIQSIHTSCSSLIVPTVLIQVRRGVGKGFLLVNRCYALYRHEIGKTLFPLSRAHMQPLAIRYMGAR